MGGRKTWAAVSFALCAAALTVAPPVATAQTAPAGTSHAEDPSRAALVRLRRQDGAQLPSPPVSTEGSGAATDSDEGLPEVEGHTAAGGTTVSLRGRFRTSVGLRRAPGGAPIGECAVDAPVSTPAD